MADVFTAKKRSAIMALVRSRRTRPEIEVARLLRKLKIRFRRNVAGLPGTPDFVLPDLQVALFVNGCFWHGHVGCRKATVPHSNRVFWRRKIEANVRRDLATNRKLRQRRFKILTHWTCATEAKLTLKLRQLHRPRARG